MSYFKSTDVETKSVEPSKQLPQACVSGTTCVSGTISDHDYVDLGLSVKWATCNVGASSFTVYGDYFAWGETEPKEDYSWKTYMWCNGGYKTINKYRYGFDNETVLESLDDAATVNWGEKWRMPTIAELQELENNCTWEWKIINGVNGYKITAKNNNWIFLPAAGYRDGTSSSMWALTAAIGVLLCTRAIATTLTTLASVRAVRTRTATTAARGAVSVLSLIYVDDNVD